MTGLMLHCGAMLASREEVLTVPVPPATDSYVPLSYEAFLLRLEKQLAVEQIAILDQKLALSRNGQRLFGLMELYLPQMPEMDFRYILGFRNSYDKSCSTGICLGASVLVCDNLSFNGEVTFTRKHTAHLLRDLSWTISETVNQLPAKFMAQFQTFERYKRAEVDDSLAHDMVIQFLDAGALNVTDIPRVLREWRTPRHPEFCEEGKSAWRLFNACTEALKGSGLWLLPERTRKIHRILDDSLGSIPIRYAEPVALAVVS